MNFLDNSYLNIQNLHFFFFFNFLYYETKIIIFDNMKNLGIKISCGLLIYVTLIQGNFHEIENALVKFPLVNY